MSTPITLHLTVSPISWLTGPNRSEFSSSHFAKLLLALRKDLISGNNHYMLCQY